MFENEYTMNRDLTKEYVFKIIGKRIMIIGLTIFIVGIILFLSLDDGMRYVMLTCSFIGLFCAIVTPITMINNLENASKRLNNGKIEKTKVAFKDNITMDEGKVHLEFEYSQIKQILETNHFVVLKLGDNSAILVYKDGFTKGNKEDFLKFISSKISWFVKMLKVFDKVPKPFGRMQSIKRNI